MAIMQFKSKNSLISWALLYLIIGTIICVVNGVGVGGAILFIVINVFVMFLGLLLGSAFQNRGATVSKNKSTGIEKIRLTIKDGVIREANKFDAEEYTPFITSIKLHSVKCSFIVIDCYYEVLRRALSEDSRFNDLAADVVKFESLQSKIIDAFLGVAIGILLYKATEGTSYEVNKNGLKKILSIGSLTKEEQKNIYERAVDAVSIFKNNGLEYPMRYLGEAAVAFFGGTLKKGDIADPTYVMAADGAFSVGYNYTIVNEENVKTLAKAGLIQKGK